MNGPLSSRPTNARRSRLISGLLGLSVRDRIAIVTLAPIVILISLLLFAPPDGNERAQLMQFVGRFHPLSVHLPIALLLVVPLFELLGRTRRFPFLLESVDLLLWLATAGAVGAAGLGWCLSRGGGYSGSLVTQHMWAGVLAGAVAWLAWLLRARASSATGKNAYAAALVVAVGLVSFAGHRGGQLSLGENTLTEFMPAPLAAFLGSSGADDPPANSPNGGPATFYGARIRPILSENCIVCHGRSKHKSNLRLDSFEAVMRGGKHGAVVKPGDATESELLRRISLPVSDDDAMPPDNRRPVPPADRKLIEQWIAAGASGTQDVNSIKILPGEPSTPVAEVKFEEPDPAKVAKQRAALAAAVRDVQGKLPGIVDYESRGSAAIVVHAAWMGSKFGDAEISLLAPLRDEIISADFSRTAITDKSAGGLASMRNLRSLRLMHTGVTDATVQALGPLAQLESLDIFGTPVTPAALPAIAHLPKLRRVYAGQTKISPTASLSQEIRGKLVF